MISRRTDCSLEHNSFVIHLYRTWKHEICLKSITVEGQFVLEIIVIEVGFRFSNNLLLEKKF